jgi:hypothetical protein
VKSKRKVLGYVVTALLLMLGAVFLFFKTPSGSLSLFDGYKSSGYFEAGKMTEDLDVHSLRWHQHDGYERLVFDIQKWDGVFGDKPYQATTKTGLYQVGRELVTALSIDGELSGYRSFSASLPSFAKSDIIKSMEIFPNDEKSFLFSINLKHSASYKVFTLTNPTRLIIDLK